MILTSTLLHLHFLLFLSEDHKLYLCQFCHRATYFVSLMHQINKKELNKKQALKCSYNLNKEKQAHISIILQTEASEVNESQGNTKQTILITNILTTHRHCFGSCFQSQYTLVFKLKAFSYHTIKDNNSSVYHTQLECNSMQQLLDLVNIRDKVNYFLKILSTKL